MAGSLARGWLPFLQGLRTRRSGQKDRGTRGRRGFRGRVRSACRGGVLWERIACQMGATLSLLPCPLRQLGCRVCSVWRQRASGICALPGTGRRCVKLGFRTDCRVRRPNGRSVLQAPPGLCALQDLQSFPFLTRRHESSPDDAASLAVNRTPCGGDAAAALCIASGCPKTIGERVLGGKRVSSRSLRTGLIEL